jgi:hypothetical protein
VRRRIFLAALVLGGTSAALIVGITPAVGKQATPPHVMQLTCNFNLTTEPPPGSTAVTAPQQKGWQDGAVYCTSNQKFGNGAIRNRYTIPTSGDTVGHFVEYFDTGTFGGHLDLTPKGGGSFGGGSFQAQNYGGTFQVWYGTGAFQGIKSTQPGTMYCKSPDSVHLHCKETMTVKTPGS